ncbi:MAG: FAD-dependent oxidoreductase [Coriobacteriia bacterium]|jgi:ferredoxin-NADP reductase|nr:FAD-dependent oxidoreductase [Coriobacteriia bacterium]
MAKYEVAVVSTLARCPDVLSVRLERPEGYTFVAGQYLTLTVETAEGEQTKPFSHSSATGDPHLEITTRLSGSAFKNALAALKPGDRVRFSGPAGRLTLPVDEPRIAFLIGGVGITPVISMLRSQDPARASGEVLFFGNREPGCIPFAQEIFELEGAGLTAVHVVEAAGEGWSGETGFITPEVVRHHIDTAEDWLFIVAGPPVMVRAMEACLDALDVPQARTLIERFGPAA